MNFECPSIHAIVDVTCWNAHYIFVTSFASNFSAAAIRNSAVTELGSPATETALRQRINLAQKQHKPKKWCFVFFFFSFELGQIWWPQLCVFQVFSPIFHLFIHSPSARLDLGLHSDVVRVTTRYHDVTHLALENPTSFIRKSQSLPNQRKKLSWIQFRYGFQQANPGFRKNNPMFSSQFYDKPVVCKRVASTGYGTTSNFFHVHVLLSNFKRCSRRFMRTSVLGQTTAYCSGAGEKQFLKGF